MVIRKSQLILRIFLWVILFFFIGFFVYLGVVPSGKIIYLYNFEKSSRFFSDLRPIERVEEIKDVSQNIIGDPVYFSVYTPRRFDKAKMTLKYKTNNIPPVVEVGVLVDKENWRYVLKPIYNKTLNQLALVWENVANERVILLQKEKKYSSVEEFLKSSFDSEKIAVYNYDLDNDYILKDYERTNKESEKYELPVSFVGAWQGLIYLKDEDLDVDFEFSNLANDNNNDNDGEIDVKLFYKTMLIATKHLDKNTDIQKMSLSALNLPEGVYRLELFSDDSVVTNKIELKQKKIVFSSKLNFYSGEKKDFNVFTDSKNVQITTVNPDNLQTVYMNDEEFEINETYKQFEIKTEKASSTLQCADLKFSKDGFSLSGDGVFSFFEDSFFNPKIKKLDRNIDVIGDGIEYVLAEYEFPVEDDAWMISSAGFNMAEAFRDNGEYEFIISVPGMRVADDINDFLTVDEIKIEFFGKSLKERFVEIFKN